MNSKRIFPPPAAGGNHCKNSTGSAPGITLGIIVAFASLAIGSAEASSEICQDLSARLLVDTNAGALEIALFENAAPVALARLVALADPASARDRAETENRGYYDGLVFNYTRPHVEIRTSEPSTGRETFDTKIDAEALGLHEQGPRDAGEAMTVMQQELLMAYARDKRGASMSPQLETWLTSWYEHHDAGFLVGVSHQEINEALGYSYTPGLDSRPVRKGSVALVPQGPNIATSRLSIALQDLPRRNGRWMVIGEVVSGLELADRISIAPLDRPRNVKPGEYQPRDPVTIESVRLVCRETPAQKTTHLTIAHNREEKQ